MKLFTSLTSPYGRKCRMAAHLAGVADAVEVTEIDYKSLEYRQVNALNKVPALARDDGSIIIDSPVICAYLASLGNADALYPEGDARWASLSREALADGITDAGVLIFLERRRDANPQSDAWIELQTGKINAALDVIDAQAAGFKGRTDIGVVAVLAAVAWLEFRAIVTGVRDGRTELSAWLDDISSQDFAIATAPPPDA